MLLAFTLSRAFLLIYSTEVLIVPKRADRCPAVLWLRAQECGQGPTDGCRDVWRVFCTARGTATAEYAFLTATC